PHIPKLTAPAKTYKASAKTKSLTATFKSANGNAISGKKISFTINGKTYTATTNSKGVATVKISLNKKGTYSATAKYAGDGMYKETSTKFKVKIS
ncbi:MAG: Ig-like domain-containing protein, partial [Methanobrevibacter sp.]|nr:Ig-like domain-containing protein [Methanobrevibacter sp.]